MQPKQTRQGEGVHAPVVGKLVVFARLSLGLSVLVSWQADFLVHFNSCMLD